jgi:hypothetical protein
MIVAQYSVHAIAGLKPDYGIHFPNIRSPEGGQFIFQISGHPKVGKKLCPVFWSDHQNQKAGISGKAIKQAMHAFGNSLNLRDRRLC